VKIALGTWAFSFGPYADVPVPWDMITQRAAEAGYDGVEICGFSPYISLEDYPTAASRRETAKQLADLNLGISGYLADLTSINPTAAENKQRYLDLFRQIIDLCVEIGSPMIRVDTASAPGSLTDLEYKAAFGRLGELWHEAADLAQQAGVFVAWEFEPGFIINKPSEVVALHKNVSHRNFKVIFDTAHAYMCSVVGARQQGKKETLKGGVLELLKLLEGRIGHVHIIDSDGTLYSDETSTHRPFGEGLIDFKSLTPHLRTVPDVRWWCIDLCFWPQAWELVKPSLQFVKDMLARQPELSAAAPEL
jgi:sugar phosphate isomerase/epimerase